MAKIQYCFKRGNELRFLSHLDQQRLFQRAFRRAGIQLEYSQGFNPHPKMSFALAMSVGLTSDCEYGEVTTTEDLSCEVFIKRLNTGLPKGLEVIDAFFPGEGSISLSADIKESQYLIQIKVAEDTSLESMEEMFNDYLRLEEVRIKKRNKKGKMVEKDIRPFIASIELDKDRSTEKSFSFRLKLIYIEQQCVKPDLIFTSINTAFNTTFIVDPGMSVHREKLEILSKS